MENNRSFSPISEETTEKKTSQLVPVYIMGKKYDVPGNLTILKAMEYAGFQPVRGCGCRGGVCGACGTVYRIMGSHKIEVGLSCQIVVQPNMYLAQLPFFPSKKAAFDIDNARATVSIFQALYPEVFKCVSCNTCTKSCPMDIEVMDYINAIIRGDFEKAAQLSFDCVMCNLCTSRCPAEISHPNAAILARRLYGRYLTPRAMHLRNQINQLKEGKLKSAIAELKKMDVSSLKKLYVERETQPNMANDEWRPKSNIGL